MPSIGNVFPEISKVQFEGPQSKNPFAFKHYNPDEIVEGKKMKDHLRFAATYWHTMRGSGSDPLAVGTMMRPWDDGSPSLQHSLNLPDVFF